MNVNIESLVSLESLGFAAITTDIVSVALPLISLIGALGVSYCIFKKYTEEPIEEPFEEPIDLTNKNSNSVGDNQHNLCKLSDNYSRIDYDREWSEYQFDTYYLDEIERQFTSTQSLL